MISKLKFKTLITTFKVQENWIAAWLCGDVRMQRTMFYLRPDVQNYYAPLSNGCMPPYSRRETMNASERKK
jgi:hypothetical protein